MAKDVELIKVDKEILGYEFDCFRTPETLGYDTLFDNPRGLFFYHVKHPLHPWNHVGNRKFEDSLCKMLFLESELNFFVGVPKEIFMTGISSYGLDYALDAKKIEIINYEKTGELIIHSKESLTSLFESMLRLKK